MTRSILTEPDDSVETLLTDLANWAPPMSREDERALSDRVLLACGWHRDAILDGWWDAPGDPGYELRFGPNGYPHPILKLDDALAMPPPGWMVVEMRLLDHPRLWMATAVHVTRGQRIFPMHVCLSVAVASAAVLAWSEERNWPS